MNAQPRLGMLAWLDVPVDCRMSSTVNEDGDVRFTLGGPYDEIDIVFEPAALDRFLRLGFDVLCHSTGVDPKALADREGLQRLATLSDSLAQTDAHTRELVVAGGAVGKAG